MYAGRMARWRKVRSLLLENRGQWFGLEEAGRLAGCTSNYAGIVMRGLVRQYPLTFERKRGSYKRALYRARSEQ